jgi:hypothetical protein
MITKISGCDQMWCTACHVAFSWRTGEVETNHIHNPHWYEWQRSRSTTGEIPREPGDVPCGGDDNLMLYQTLDHVLKRVHGLTTNNSHYIYMMQIHREVRHIQRVELPGLRTDTDRARERRNLDLRLQYLLKRVDRAEWKRKLILREKSTARKMELRQIYQMYCTVAIDNVNALRHYQPTGENENPTGKTVFDALTEIKALAHHANEAFKSACRRYSCAVRHVYGDSISM